jgi:hypothetical protein
LSVPGADPFAVIVGTDEQLEQLANRALTVDRVTEW